MSSSLSLSLSTESQEQLPFQKRVLVPIGTGSEEIETTCITDTLTRFGAHVVVATVMPDKELITTMSRGIKIVCDTTIEEAAKEEWDLIALPGGMPGAQHLKDSSILIDLLHRQQQQQQGKGGKTLSLLSRSNKSLNMDHQTISDTEQAQRRQDGLMIREYNDKQQQQQQGFYYGAVCASPAVVLSPNNLLTKDGGSTCYPAPVFRNEMVDPVDDLVVVQDNLVTSQGPGTSLLFAIQLGEMLYGKEKADEIAKAMLENEAN
eukprot:CAMPEP_0118703644 /NCGR_PEP_ID=MMETSP0800-20121206/18694_1 /TAXON_ID=210618 ORGANISM="Striatella unipunctata, Strain CCMP2910" /NCGR_SAMPLE_ID=MMETSP0800 /ASSEMBLY_ACC=CAM_ASM_000638 /LENGTH=261 /DNA_ID=CAMNT_0006605245 /DNA_START=119 /DNA_END=903 /DNA_ORIENTATION=+